MTSKTTTKPAPLEEHTLIAAHYHGGRLRKEGETLALRPDQVERLRKYKRIA